MILPATYDGIHTAASLIQMGEVVAFPTETVYGLGADALSERAVEKIYALKGRPRVNPLIVHLLSIDSLDSVAIIPTSGQRAIWFASLTTLWPGPLTIVLPKHNVVPDITSGGLGTVGVRIPSHPVAREFLSACGIPVAAPSANRSLGVSPTNASHVSDEFGEQLPILDGGASIVGLESTIISLASDTPRILRHGAFSAEYLAQLLDLPLESLLYDGQDILAPGMMRRHYSPRTPVILKENFDPSNPSAKVGFIGFSPEGRPPFPFSANLVLSPSGDLAEVASQLFSALREQDKLGLDLIVVDSCPEFGIGRAIMDRLTRATAT